MPGSPNAVVQKKHAHKGRIVDWRKRDGKEQGWMKPKKSNMYAHVIVEGNSLC